MGPRYQAAAAIHFCCTIEMEPLYRTICHNTFQLHIQFRQGLETIASCFGIYAPEIRCNNIGNNIRIGHYFRLRIANLSGTGIADKERFCSPSGVENFLIKTQLSQVVIQHVIKNLQVIDKNIFVMRSHASANPMI